LFASLVLVCVISLEVSTSGAPGATETPLHHLKRGFRNANPQYHYSLAGRAKRLFTLARALPRGAAFTVASNNGAALRANGFKPTLTWVGHSTFLIQLDGVNILTDPHWGDRASPVKFAGPKRMVKPGLRFEDLPPIDAVVISHDHYDHLDIGTVTRLAREHAPRFFVPLGVKQWLEDQGITNAMELDWWDSTIFRGLTFVCTPAQHSSGRGLRDQNMRLWSSWVIGGRAKRLFFAGDTGYYGGLREIGGQLGPFDVAALPVGGYSSYRTRHPNHLNPEEALTVFQEIHARRMVPMHWGTFDMNREPFREPPDRLRREATRRGIEAGLAVLSPGETLHW
jgi:N-acyl-phosphatidylethanolamine-hydrolysing phospholipase D